MELVDLVDSKSSAFGRVGSNPTCGTTLILIPPQKTHKDSQLVFLIETD